MTASNRAQTTAAALGRIAFSVALWSGILLGVRAAFGVLIPPQWCGGTPVDDIAYILAWGMAMGLAAQRNKPGLGPDLRQATVMAAGLIVAVLAARLIAGCTPLTAWLDDSRFVVEIVVMLAILIPLAHFHTAVIEPRWARAMGEAKDA